MNRVLVLGANGMLGSHVAEELGSAKALDVVLASRDQRVGGVHRGECVSFDYAPGSIRTLLSTVGGVTHIVNCVGLPRGRSTNRLSRADLFLVNGLLPLELADAIRGGVTRVVHIGSDGVFAGTRERPYVETDSADDRSDYGLSKAIGEARAPRFLTLRTSIVGLAPWRNQQTLLDWLVTQPFGAAVPGYVNQFWNGVTALALARLIAVLIQTPVAFSEGLLHVSSRDRVTKFGLLETAASALGREDLEILPHEDGPPTNRVLGSCRQSLVSELWRQAGYATQPSIQELLAEYGKSRGRLK